MPFEPGSLAGATCSFRLRLLIAYKHDARAREPHAMVHDLPRPTPHLGGRVQVDVRRLMGEGRLRAEWFDPRNAERLIGNSAAKLFEPPRGWRGWKYSVLVHSKSYD